MIRWQRVRGVVWGLLLAAVGDALHRTGCGTSRGCGSEETRLFLEVDPRRRGLLAHAPQPGADRNRPQQQGFCQADGHARGQGGVQEV